MSVVSDFSSKRGEDIIFVGDAETGDPALATLTVGKVKKLRPGRSTLRGDEAVAAEFQVTLRAAAPPAPAGWSLLIPSAVSAQMDAGFYIFDLRIDIAAGRELTQSIIFELEQSVSG